MWWIIGGIAAVVVIVAITAVLVLSRGYSSRKLERLWNTLDQQPGVVLPQLRALIPQLEKQLAQVTQSQGDVTDSRKSLTQVHVGIALCCLALTKRDEAIVAEQAARKAGGAFADEWITRLSKAWLAADPVTWPAVAIDDLSDYLGLPETAQQQDLRKQVQDTVLRLTQLPESPSEQQLQTVIEIGQRVVQATPGFSEVQYRLGLALHLANRPADAQPHLSTAAQAAPNDPQRQLAWARVLWDNGEQGPSRSAYLAAYRLQRDPAIAYETGIACLRTSDIPFATADGPEVAGRQPLACAVRFFTEATKGFPEWVEAWLSLGEASLQLDQFEQAQAALARVLELDPGNGVATSLIGRCHLSAGNTAGARDSLAELKRTQPDSPETWRLAADLAFQDDQFSTALPLYRKLAAVVMVTPELIRRQARCELEAGDPHQARRLLEERPHLDPDSRLILGRSLARTGQWSQALKTLQAEHGNVISHEYAYYTAQALAANQHYSEAGKIVQQLSDHPVWGARARRTAGHIALLRGDQEGAEQHYRSTAEPAWQSFDLGRLALARQDLDAAEQQFQQGTALGGDKQRSPALRVTGRQLRFARALVSAHQGGTDVIDEFEGDLDTLPYLQEVIADREYQAGRYKQALPLYEQSIRQRDSVPTTILTRLATGYLHQQRFREALPHLVAVSQRDPDNTDLAENLAYCRTQLAREHFKQGRWEAALLEFEGARLMLQRLRKPQSAALAVWEAECRFRAAVQLLTSSRLRQPKRAVELFTEATQTHENEARNWFGLGLSRAALAEWNPAVAATTQAVKLKPDHIGIVLGHALTLQQAGRTVEARQSFQKGLQLLSSQTPTPRTRFLELAARSALGMSAAQDREWKLAAEALQPLLQHPDLKEKDSRITVKDIATALVAYHGLAGNKAAATDLAKKYLPGETLGDILIAVVQAEAGDYAGAAATLEPNVNAQSPAKVRDLLLACWLNVAAAKVKANDIPGAEAALTKILSRQPAHKLALKLQEALKFAERFKNFDPKQLDTAISNCRQLVQDTKSSQLVRTLGVLLHRKALSGDGLSPSGVDWKECYDYWSSRILRDKGFWQPFGEEYNAGKGKREKVKDEDLRDWQNSLPNDLASEHAQLAANAIRSRNMNAASLHLQYIWKWEPGYKYEMNDLIKSLGQPVDESLANFLVSLLNSTSDTQVRKFLEPLAAQAELAKVGPLLNEAVQHLQQMAQLRDRALALVDDIKRGNVAMLFVMKSLLSQARDKARQARDAAEKAKRLAPGNSEVEQVFKICKDAYNGMNDLCNQIGA